MSPYVEGRDDQSATAAWTVLIVVLIIAAIFAIGYFAWYAPYRAGNRGTDIRVNVPQQQPDTNAQRTPPPDTGTGNKSGQGAGPGGTDTNTGNPDQPDDSTQTTEPANP